MSPSNSQSSLTNPLSGPRLALLVTLIGGALFSRLLPHPPNFTAVGAAAIFAGAMLPMRWALLVPLVAMILGDAILGFHSLTLPIYFSVALSAVLGRCLKPQSSSFAFAGMGAVSAFVFFFVTNFAVWAFQDMYPKTWEGLGMCYVAALPFLQNMIWGDVVFAFVLVGAIRLCELKWASVRLAAV